VAASNTRTWVAPNLYQRGDGRFVAGFSIDGHWRMRTLQATSMREAQIEVAHLRSAVAAPPEEEPVLVARAIEEFLARFEAQVSSGERSPRTLDNYRWVLTAYVLPAWGEREVAGLTPDDIVSLSQVLRERGVRAPTLRAIEAAESRLFSFACRRGYIEQNPFSKLERGERAKARPEDRRVLTQHEVERLLARADGLFTRALLACLLYTGVRQGELLGLRWGDVDFEHGLVRLREQLQRPGKGRPARLGPLKMDSQRDVILLPQLAGLLREHRSARLHPSDDDFVFANLDGTPLHYSQMNRLLAKTAKAAGVEKVSAHVFRRTFASHLIIEQGLDVVRVQRQLGHSRPSVTSDRYSFLFEQARHADELRHSMAASAYAAPLGLAEPLALVEP
jgi:integrase